MVYNKKKLIAFFKSSQFCLYKKLYERLFCEIVIWKNVWFILIKGYLSMIIITDRQVAKTKLGEQNKKENEKKGGEKNKIE